MPRAAAPAVLALVLVACARPADRVDPAASAPEAASTDAPSVVAPTASAASAPSLPSEGSSNASANDEPVPLAASAQAAPAAAPPVAVESRRSLLTRLSDDPALAAHEAVLREHFGGAVPSPLEVQSTPIGGDRRAVLVYGPARQRAPLILVLDGHGGVVWTKERPLAGTRQIVTEMVLAPGPRGEVALLWCDIPTQVVALRKWSWEGTVLADFQVAEVDVCEALSAVYWPARGWLAVASQGSAARAQLLDEHGRRAFGPSGTELPWQARPSAPVSLVVDTDTSAMLFQVGDARREGGAVAEGRLLGMRLDSVGTPLWEHPLEVGVAPAGAPSDRVQLALTAPGKVRVALGKTDAKIAVTVTSAGSILAR
jgi:hypothetical protein